MNPIEKLILKETKGLPPFVLNEVLDFILFIKEKKLKKDDDTFKSSLESGLSLLDHKERVYLRSIGREPIKEELNEKIDKQYQ